VASNSTSSLPKHQRLSSISKEHGTTPDDAIATYFDGVANHDAEHRRFVTMTATHTLFWNWIEQGSSVYVISCIRAGE
jgi:hypothetical protein